MTRYLILLLIISLFGCKSPQYTAKTKADLSKLCVYEFPPNFEPIKIESVTSRSKGYTIKLGTIDCTKRTGVVEVPVKCESDTIYIETTKYIKDSAQLVYILSLEAEKEAKQRELEHLKERTKRDLKALEEKYKIKSKQDRNQKMRLYGVIILLAGILIYRVLKIFR